MFIETSAILNHVKVVVFSSMRVPVPTRAEAIAYFIRKTINAQQKLNTSKRVIDQLKHRRDMLERELMRTRISPEKIARLVQMATKSTQDFLNERVVISDIDGTEHAARVRSFFERYKTDQRMIAVAELKEEKGRGKQTTMPEDSDLLIFCDALELSSKYFLTTDQHFCAIDPEIKVEFKIEVINHFNARTRADDLFPV